MSKLKTVAKHVGVGLLFGGAIAFFLLWIDAEDRLKVCDAQVELLEDFDQACVQVLIDEDTEKEHREAPPGALKL